MNEDAVDLGAHRVDGSVGGKHLVVVVGYAVAVLVVDRRRGHALHLAHLAELVLELRQHEIDARSTEEGHVLLLPTAARRVGLAPKRSGAVG